MGRKERRMRTEFQDKIQQDPKSNGIDEVVLICHLFRTVALGKNDFCGVKSVDLKDLVWNFW